MDSTNIGWDTSEGCRSCMAIPGKILKIFSGDDQSALVDALGVHRKINVALLQENLTAGDWVLIHVGFAMSKISEADAFDHLHTMELLLKISQYRDGVRRAEACKMDLSYPVGVTIFCNT
jgi:hydrogenase expression/formation protein HypC